LFFTSFKKIGQLTSKTPGKNQVDFYG